MVNVWRHSTGDARSLDGVAPPSHLAYILGRRAWPTRRLARLGATPDVHHGLRAMLRRVRVAMRSGGWSDRGFTFIEVLVVSAIVMILASAAIPLARVTATRAREAELRRSLREMRTAIDKFKDAADAQQIALFDLKAGAEGYPADLQTLVDGVGVPNDATGRKLKFLRRIPVDPMTRSADWGLRSYQDAPDSRRWGGQNVFDVFTTASGTALDGTKYADW